MASRDVEMLVKLSEGNNLSYLLRCVLKGKEVCPAHIGNGGSEENFEREDYKLSRDSALLGGCYESPFACAALHALPSAM